MKDEDFHIEQITIAVIFTYLHFLCRWFYQYLVFQDNLYLLWLSLIQHRINISFGGDSFYKESADDFIVLLVLTFCLAYCFCCFTFLSIFKCHCWKHNNRTKIVNEGDWQFQLSDFFVDRVCYPQFISVYFNLYDELNG